MPAASEFQRFLGSSFTKRYDGDVLRIGEQRFTRYQLSHDLDCCATPKTAGILTAALAALGVRTTAAALRINPVDLADVPGVGVTTVYLFLCWQRFSRSAADVTAWMVSNDAVSFTTLQARARKRKAREQDATPKRRRKAR